MRAVEGPTPEPAEAGAAVPAALFIDLQHKSAEAHGVVAGHDPFFLMTEDLLEVLTADGDEGGRGVRRRAGEARVVVGDEALAQVPVSGGHGGDPRHAQLVHEPALHGAVGALTAAAGLRGIAQDVLDPQAGPGPADLRELGEI